jgi:hypothetical protein
MGVVEFRDKKYQSGGDGGVMGLDDILEGRQAGTALRFFTVSAGAVDIRHLATGAGIAFKVLTHLFVAKGITEANDHEATVILRIIITFSIQEISFILC